MGKKRNNKRNRRNRNRNVNRNKVVSQDPAAAKEPADVRESSATKKPADAKEPEIIEKPADIKEPEDIEKPADAQESADAREKEPAVVKEPENIENPADTEEPEPENVKESADAKKTEGTHHQKETGEKQIRKSKKTLAQKRKYGIIAAAVLICLSVIGFLLYNHRGSEISNEYITVTQYRGLEVNKVDEGGAAEDQLKQEVWQAVMNKTEVKKYPEEKIAEYKQAYEEYYQGKASSFGLDYQTYLERNGYSDKRIEYLAQQKVKKELITDLIIEKEKGSLSQKYYQKKYKEYAQKNGFSSVDELLKALPEETLKEWVREEYVTDLLVKKCKQK